MPTNPNESDPDLIDITPEQAQEAEVFAGKCYYVLCDAVKQREGVEANLADEVPTHKYSVEQLRELRDCAEFAQLFFAGHSNGADCQEDHESVREPQRRCGSTDESCSTRGRGEGRSRGRLASKYGRLFIHTRVTGA